MKKIDISHPAINTATIDRLELSERDAVAVYKFLLSLGATKDIELFYQDYTTIQVKRKIIYGKDHITGKPLRGDKYYSLSDYLTLLLRYYKIKEHKINAIKGALARTENTLTEVKKALSL